MSYWSEDDIINAVLLHGNNATVFDIIKFLGKNENTAKQIFLHYYINTMIYQNKIGFSYDNKLYVIYE